MNNRIQEVLSQHSFGKQMSDPTALIPDDALSDELKAKIDSEEFGPLDLVNGEFGSKYAPRDVLLEGSPFPSMTMASQRLPGNSAKVWWARKEDSCPTKINRDRAFCYPVKDLLDTVSNLDAEPSKEGMIRFNLPAAAITMRGYGTPQPAPVESYVHWYCKENNPGAEEHDFSKSGVLYRNTCNLATVWNASMWHSMGKPDPSTPEYDKFMNDVAYSKHDVEQAYGAIAYMYNRHPEKVKNFMTVAFSHLPEMDNTGKHPNTAELYRHVSTIQDEAELQKRLDLIATRKAGEWSDEAHWRSTMNIKDAPAPTQQRPPATKMHMVPPEKYCFDIADHRYPGSKCTDSRNEWGQNTLRRQNSTVTRVSRKRDMYKQAAQAVRSQNRPQNRSQTRPQRRPSPEPQDGFQGAYRRRR